MASAPHEPHVHEPHVHEPHVPEPRGHDADVVVIGGGMAGASAAWSLAPHARVVLVEREATAGQHATGRSASVLSETSGHPVVCALARASRRFFAAPPHDFCATPLLSPRGLMWVGRAEDEATLDAFWRAARTVAPEIRRLSAREAMDRLAHFRPAAVSGGGVHEPDAMAIDTATLLQSYIAGARRRGATIVTAAEATRCVRTAGGWLVFAGDAEIHTRHVVDAAGPWGDVVADRSGVRPLGLRALRRTAALIPAPDWVSSWPLVMDIGGRYYLEPEAGGLLVSPADETESEPCDARAEEIDVALALERVGEATDVPVRTVRHAWAGLRTFAPDRVPVVGQDADCPGFWWLVGQGGAGIKTAPAMAALLAALLLDHEITPEQRGFVDAVSPARLR